MAVYTCELWSSQRGGNSDDGSCLRYVRGCTDSSAGNYNETATLMIEPGPDDTTCAFPALHSFSCGVEGYYLVDNALGDVISGLQTAEACAATCLLNPTCKSFNYQAATNQCHMRKCETHCPLPRPASAVRAVAGRSLTGMNVPESLRPRTAPPPAPAA